MVLKGWVYWCAATLNPFSFASKRAVGIQPRYHALVCDNQQSNVRCQFES
jgi:hypothetical protein